MQEPELFIFDFQVRLPEMRQSSVQIFFSSHKDLTF